MKTDKILFGATCLIMGFIVHSTSNQACGDSPKQCTNTTVLSDSVRLKPALDRDTICLTNAVKSDTLKLLQKVK